MSNLDTDDVPMPIVTIDQDADPEATMVQINFGDRLGALIDTRLTDPYFNGLTNAEHEPVTQPIPKLEFEFERMKLTEDDVREPIYRGISFELDKNILKTFNLFQNNVVICDGIFYEKKADFEVSSANAGGVSSWTRAN